MIWASSLITAQKHGDTRTIVRRAWLPKRINDSLIWLAQYEQLQAWQSRKVEALVAGEIKLFEIGEWITAAEIVVRWKRA